MTTVASKIIQQLHQACLAYAIAPRYRESLGHYLSLLMEWNRIHNLISAGNPFTIVPRHVGDSLSIAAYLQGPTILDVGTGAGLPGLPLAITHPEWEFTLLDSNGKKMRFLTYVVAMLGLRNVKLIHERVEAFRPTNGYHDILSRALGSLVYFLEYSKHLCHPDGRFLVMKGRSVEQTITPQFTITDVIPITVAGLNAKRHLMIVKQNAIASNKCN